MPRPPIDLARKIKDILHHVEPLPVESRAPILHYSRSGAELWSSIAYFERAVAEGDRYRAVVDRHLGNLYGMTLVNLVETFERFLKESAAACIDHLCDFVVDDRFDLFKIRGSALASHFAEGSLGKSLCESSTWLDCEETNKRYRKLLSEPFQVGGQFFELFPKQPPADLQKFELMNLVWQIRHTAVHNLGIITHSDAVKMQLWAKENVDAPRILSPTRSDLNYLKRFIDEMASQCNRRIGERLASLLTSIHARTPGLFLTKVIADRIATIFQLPLQVAGDVGDIIL